MTEQGSGLDRITVLESVYYRPYNQQPIALEIRSSRSLKSDEKPYQRQNHKKTVATEEWKEVDFGWLENDLGLFVIQNDEGSMYETIPTEDEKSEDKKKVLEIGFGTPENPPQDVWLIPPHESFRGSPSSSSNVMIRSQHKEIKYTLTAFPK
jgi:hypothetical protein